MGGCMGTLLIGVILQNLLMCGFAGIMVGTETDAYY